MMHLPLYSNSRTRKFTDIWGEADDFLSDYKEFNYNNEMLALNALNDDIVRAIYYLLYSKYGNSSVASSDENRFKYDLYTTIFSYGPTWAKKIKIQSDIRKMELDELQKGGKAIYNTAFNPSQPVANGEASESGEGTNSLEELKYINQQNTTNYKKSKIDAYTLLLDLLETDVTSEFLRRFQKLFKYGPVNELPLYYITEINTIIDDGGENE